MPFWHWNCGNTKFLPMTALHLRIIILLAVKADTYPTTCDIATAGYELFIQCDKIAVEILVLFQRLGPAPSWFRPGGRGLLARCVSFSFFFLFSCNNSSTLSVGVIVIVSSSPSSSSFLASSSLLLLLLPSPPSFAAAAAAGGGCASSPLRLLLLLPPLATESTMVSVATNCFFGTVHC